MQSHQPKYPLSDLEEAILSVLSRAIELYGLQITRTIEAGSNGRLTVGFGSLYPALRRLESRRFVESHWGDDSLDDRGGARRRYYKVTTSGARALEEKRSIRDSIANQEPIMA